MKTAAPAQNGAARRQLICTSPSFCVVEEYREALAGLGLTSLDAVFAFDAGRDLAKPNIGRFRRRLQFEVRPAGSARPVKVFLKRYDHPPIVEQLRRWLSHRRHGSLALLEHQTAERLAAAGIKTPRTVACGEQWRALFERRSFLMTEEIEDSQSLERRLPACFESPETPARRQARRAFIPRLASFIREFHGTGYRHRDLYFSHIFCSDTGEFCLIDLARASRPLLQERFRIKDIAQLHYSAPAASFSNTDRLRFYLAYAGRRRFLPQDKVFIRRVVQKAGRMARHNLKHGIPVPFLSR